MKIGNVSVEVYNEVDNLYLRKQQYGMNGRTCITAHDVNNGEAFGVVTTNLPDEPLEDDEFFVKTWSENRWVPQLLTNCDLFEDTGKRVPSGFVEVQIWKLKNA